MTTTQAELQISERVSFPLEFVTMTQVILARKGAGKTNTAVVQAEELLKLGQQLIIVDPTGAWWGLKSSADGTKAGFPVYVFGGEHADVPLEESAGEQIASAILESGISAILDLSELRKGAMHRFMAAFLETLYRLSRTARHLIVDEADTLAPQRPFGEEARTLGAMQDIVRRGRVRGIGCTMITQRPQVLNKDVLTQADVLCVLQMTHNRDIGAVEEWVSMHADPATAKEMMQSLPSLPRGAAWFWAPQLEILTKDQVRRRETFDSSATPKPGQTVVAPKVLAEVDVAKLSEQVLASVKAVEDNSPAKLRARIKELEERLAMPNDLEAELREAKQERDKARDFLIVLAARLAELANEVRAAGAGGTATEPLQWPLEVEFTDEPVSAPPPPSRLPARAVKGGGQLGRCERAVLIVLAQLGTSSKSRISILSGYSLKSSSFSNALSALRTRGLAEGGDPLTITSAGRKELGSYTPLPTGKTLLSYWLGRLGKAEATILAVLARGPKLTREQIAQATGYSLTSSSFSNALSTLRTLELAEGRDPIALTREFKEAISR